ncbi:MAG: hypothetical protein J1E98_00515 [Lachnospiraceae bacterium]|nr:hypothetical protein [Lachnospiraceae bacterium]
MATIKSFEVDRWSERDEKGRVQHIGMLKLGEVFEMLKEHLISKDMLPDEYFLMNRNDWNKDWELPDYDYAVCVPNFGGSEGIYLDISLIYRDEQEQKQYLNFATGKTLEESVDAFLKMSRIAAECSLMLNGRGSHYTKSDVDVSLNPEQALYLTNLLERNFINNMDTNERDMLTGILKQLVCVCYVSILAVCRQEGELFSLWLHDMPDVRLEALLAESSVQKGKLDELIGLIPVDDKQHLYLIREAKESGEYCLYTHDAGKYYHSFHKQEGRRLFGTKEEIINEIEALGRK